MNESRAVERTTRESTQSSRARGVSSSSTKNRSSHVDALDEIEHERAEPSVLPIEFELAKNESE